MNRFLLTLFFAAILVALWVAKESGKQSVQVQAELTPAVTYRQPVRGKVTVSKTVHVPVAVPNDSADSLRRIAEIEETRELRRRYRKAFGKDPIW